MFSRVINRKKSTPATPLPNDPWQPRRVRHWRVIYRGKDKKLHFHSQQPDEVVRRIVHRHWWFLVQPGLPFLGAVFIFLLILGGAFRFPLLGSLWVLLEISAGVLLVATAVWFIWRDIVTWWYDIDIITNKRLIQWRGFLSPTRKETGTDKIQQVALEQKNFLEYTLGFGNLHLYLVGGEIILKEVPNPRKVREALQNITDEVRANKKPDPIIPVPADPVMAKIIADLGKLKDVPKLPNPDDRYPPLRDGRRLGPRRTFGGPLRIVCDVRYSFGESTVMYLQRSWIVLARRLALPIIALLIVLPLTVYIPLTGALGSFLSVLASFWWFLVGLVILALLLTIAVIWINYVDDVYIMTNRRIIDIERKVVFLYEERMEVEYKNIRDVKVTIPNILFVWLDIGNVYIETPGSNPDIEFDRVRHPFFIQDKINELKGFKDKVDDAKKENDRKKELQMWFGTVLTTIEQEQSSVPHAKAAPDLRHMDLFDAMERAEEFGLQVVVAGEELTVDDIGKVVHQNPPHGTLIEEGSELEVWLGRALTAADLI